MFTYILTVNLMLKLMLLVNYDFLHLCMFSVVNVIPVTFSSNPVSGTT